MQHFLNTALNDQTFIDKPESESLSKIQAPNPKESNPNRVREIWTLGCL